jgi:hypothetical protein
LSVLHLQTLPRAWRQSKRENCLMGSKQKKHLVSKAHVDHPVGWVCGVKLGDTKLQAAEKAVQTMRDAGFPATAIRKAERMIANYKANGGQ